MPDPDPILLIDNDQIYTLGVLQPEKQATY